MDQHGRARADPGRRAAAARRAERHHAGVGAGLAARIDYDDAISGTIGQVATDWGLRSSVGVPVSVEGRLLGAMVAAFTRPEHLPGDTETRLAGFTELVATAIANAGAQAEVTASRARIVAAADQARLRDRAGPARWRPAAAGYAGAAAARGAGRGAARARGAGRGTRPRCRRSDRRAGRAARDRARHPPAILAKGGLRRALKTLARRSPIPVELQVRADERLPDQVEVSAYYVVAEALTNAARHSRASAVSVEVEVAGEVLRVAVRDDGAGGADLARGTGLVGLKDRVQALGGRYFPRQPGPGPGPACRRSSRSPPRMTVLPPASPRPRECRLGLLGPTQ